MKRLTDVGFTVVSVTTDNHRVNQSWHNSLGDDNVHPVSVRNPYFKNEEHFHILYDSVHIFKNIYYCLLKNKKLEDPPFPLSATPRYLYVDFNHLVKIYNYERGNPAKLAHKLNDKVLRPSALERVNVSLAAAATHESTTKALRHFADNISGHQ